MRILVIQLARFGDIFQSWPTWRALLRRNPGCELHVLVRERFRAAADDFPGITVHALPTREILRPIAEGDGTEVALRLLENFFNPLRELGFERIINLSFSPLASYLTDWLGENGAQLSGYTRHSDGHFQAPDDTSAYFHAQVGIGRSNRFHVTQLFASVAGVELIPEDVTQSLVSPSDRTGIAVHLAASQAEKAYPPELWIQALQELAQRSSEPITLIGSTEERALSEAVAAQVPQVINRVGQTNLKEVFTCLSQARLLIGGDSAPVHIAALTGTPVLNLSCALVNFWETGPLSEGSRILFADELAAISPTRIADEAAALAKGQEPSGPCFIRPGLFEFYQAHDLPDDRFSWEIVLALYTDAVYPKATLRADKLALQRLFELAELALQQLARWTDPKAFSTAVKILAQVDEMLVEVSRLSPRVDPIIQWFQTERLRIPPESDQSTLERTTKCFRELYIVTSLYREPDESEVTLRDRAIKMCTICAPSLREYEFASINDSFQTLVSTLHDLARHSTKVADQPWSYVLAELNTSLENRDFIQLADLLQWKLAPALQQPIEKETLKQDVIF